MTVQTICWLAVTPFSVYVTVTVNTVIDVTPARMWPEISPSLSIFKPFRPLIENAPRRSCSLSSSARPCSFVADVAAARCTITCRSTSSPSVFVCGAIGAIEIPAGGGGGGGGGAVIVSVLPLNAIV